MKTRVLVSLLAVASLSLAVPAFAAEPTPIAEAKPVATSDKPKPGCCCFPKKDGEEWGCDWGLTEAKCKAASEALKLRYKWTEGKCPKKEG